MMVSSTLKEVWATTPGCVFLLRAMPEGVSFFTADTNTEVKLRLLLFAAEKSIPISVVFDDQGTETREATEIRLAVDQGG